ncbi:hypothetical protein A3A21_03375 [Candidatus Jorgensenbacteria bacterium RIFCSPLOWO2_01_FULL_45_25b]|uniref:Recombination protein RecR n=1 Tax=Candidatus Jorgensenbacteria bacterium RIFCSPLOWO2_01_FULL_45_25b TaxID=1798471 RepID=A0A1F6BZ01_9BACT|nr:MAG: hypothetical protein A3A21_03375 [Candidatus Jorgensenbacteria bacterium RIFCSPLOWO2_01_FULL_45_25b]
MIPDSIKNFIECFRRLPGFGPRAATRLAFYIANLDERTRNELTRALHNLQTIDRCEHCFFVKEKNENFCIICKNPQRTKTIVAIVEKDTDVMTMERVREFNGTYLVLGELHEQGMLGSVQKLRLERLKENIKNLPEEKLEELIVALNPHTISDIIFELIKQDFKELAEKITRLGRGIPTGGEIEFADEETLRNALKRRI